MGIYLVNGQVKLVTGRDKKFNIFKNWSQKPQDPQIPNF